MLGQQWPEPVAATLADLCAQALAPEAGRAKFAAPCPQPSAEQVKRVFLGEANGAVYRMGDAGADTRGVGGTDFRYGDGQCREPVVGLAKGCFSGNAGSGRLFGQYRQLLLDRLERPDGLAELLALSCIVGGHVQQRMQRPGGLRRAEHRAAKFQDIDTEAVW
ncbi:hypothetical protein D3C72_1240730 [compost metagenome]